jgi:hypothetical protein
MPESKGTNRRRLRLVVAQPLLNFVAKKNARTRELAAAMELPFVACGASLASHVGAGNRWKGCQQTASTAADTPNPIAELAAELNPPAGALADSLPFSLTSEPAPADNAAQRYLFAEDGEPCE